MLFLTYGVIAGLGSARAFTGNLNNIPGNFSPDRRGLASGIVLVRVLASGRYFCTCLAEYFMAQTHDVSRASCYYI